MSPEHVERTTDWEEFSGGVESEYFREYLELMQRIDDIPAYKQRTYDLLGPLDGASVLDAGCGLGVDAFRLADRVGSSGRVVGVDNSESLIAEARKQLDEPSAASFEVADVYDLPFSDDEFDAARADRILQHLSEPQDALGELLRIVEPGGRLTVTDPDWSSFALSVRDTDDTGTLLDTEYCPARNPEMGKQLYGRCRRAGLTDLTVEPYTVTMTEPEVVIDGTQLQARGEAVVEAGQLTEEAVDAWFDALDATASEDALFGCVTGVTIAGTVPE